MLGLGTPARATGEGPWGREGDASLGGTPPHVATPHHGTLAFLPLFHVIGFTNNFLHNLACGLRCMLFLDAHSTPMSGALLLRAAAELRPSIVDTVPALLEAMLADPSPSHAAHVDAAHAAVHAHAHADADAHADIDVNAGEVLVSARSASALAHSASGAEAARVLRRCSAVLYGGAHLGARSAALLRAGGVRLYAQYGTSLGVEPDGP